LVFALSLGLQLSIWPVFEVQRMVIRASVKTQLVQGIPASDLLTFRFTEEQYGALEFEDEGREVELNGAMHDIVRTERCTEGRVEVQVVRDEAETALLGGLDRRVRAIQEDDAQGRQQRRVLVGMWPSFQEVPGERVFVLTASERRFAELRVSEGRSADVVEPGPPRVA
jgi:hypothetical protein